MNLIGKTGFFYDKFKKGNIFKVYVADGEVYVDLKKMNGVAAVTYKDI